MNKETQSETTKTEEDGGAPPRTGRRILLIGDENIYRAGVEAVLTKANLAYDLLTDPGKVIDALGEPPRKSSLIIYVNPTDHFATMFGMCSLRIRAPRIPMIAFFNNAASADRESLADIGIEVVADGRNAGERLLDAILENLKTPAAWGNER